MDVNKLKALKVVDLKAVLAKANVQVPAKANKGDLISKIQASKPAQDAYFTLYPQDDLLAPPEDVDWNVDQPVIAPTPKESKQPPTKPATPPPTVAPSADPELEKRRKRAERFGIPFVEPKKPTTSDAAEKLNARAARFGIEAQPNTTPASAPSNDKKNLKRPAPQVDTVDTEELERRKKRAERFGTAKTS